jgi:large exoprotein involved in heme utilization and adhesion
MSFVGGPVSIGAPDTPSYVVAPAGRINLVSVASPGEASFDGTGFNTAGFAQLGDVRIQGSGGVLEGPNGPSDLRQLGSVVDGKEVFIRGGQLVISEGVILPGASSLPTFVVGPPPDGGEVNIEVRGAVTITGTLPEFFTNAPPGILVFNGFIDPVMGPVFIPGVETKVPDVTINAGSVSLSGFASVQSNRFGPGAAPTFTINAGSLTVENGAGIGLFNLIEGPGGQLNITAPQITLSGDGVAGGAVGVTGLLAQGLFHPLFISGASIDPVLTLSDSGTITINAAQNLTVKSGAQITTDSRSFGRSDDITINAGNMTLTDPGSVIAAQSLFAGDSGDVTINATGQITIDNGFVVSANTFGSGESGNVTVNAGQGITISGTASGIASQTGSPPQVELDLFAQIFYADPATFARLVGDLGLDPATATILDVLGPLADFGLIPALKVTPGNAGTISVMAPSILVSGQNSAIDSGTAWGIKAMDGTVFGNAGAVHVSGTNVTVNGGGEIRSRSGILNLETGALDLGAGNAGTVTVTASDTLTVSGLNSAVSTSTFGDGNGGDVRLNAGNRVAIVNDGRVSADSGGTIGGAVHSGTGLGGNITITAGNEIVLDKGQVTTQTLSADGGNITLIAPRLVRLDNSVISTSVQDDVGGGGNIMIDPEFVLVNNSSIIANAFGGPGGNITIIANNFLQSATSVITASSALSTPGVIEVRSPENNVENNIAQLPAAFVDASALLRGLCTARRTGAPSSFTVAGRGGVPVDADGYLPAFGTDATTATAGRTGEQPLVFALLANTLDCAR